MPFDLVDIKLISLATTGSFHMIFLIGLIIEVSVENRISYENYMMENPLIARRKKVNLKGLVT